MLANSINLLYSVFLIISFKFLFIIYSNDITMTVDFLTNLTMKSQEEKDDFFK